MFMIVTIVKPSFTNAPLSGVTYVNWTNERIN